MPSMTRTAAALAAVVLLGAAVVHAEGNKSSAKQRQLLITSATVDRGSNTVTLRGMNFGARPVPIVYCETYQMHVLSASDEELVVAFPASSLDGTYLFSVIRGESSLERAAFYVTTSAPEIIAGPEGPMGPQGPAGPAGPEGARGEAGPQGERGPQGLKGDTGTAGAAGPAGPQGPEGKQGAQGAPGPQGPKGADGLQGPVGPQGPAGPQGMQGLPGIAGANGVSGYERVIADTGFIWLNPSAASWISASCPAGKKVVSGGYEVSRPEVVVTASQPFGDVANGWRVSFRNATAASLTSVQVKAHAVCAAVN